MVVSQSLYVVLTVRDSHAINLANSHHPIIPFATPGADGPFVNNISHTLSFSTASIADSSARLSVHLRHPIPKMICSITALHVQQVHRTIDLSVERPQSQRLLPTSQIIDQSAPFRQILLQSLHTIHPPRRFHSHNTTLQLIRTYRRPFRSDTGRDYAAMPSVASFHPSQSLPDMFLSAMSNLILL